MSLRPAHRHHGDYCNTKSTLKKIDPSGNGFVLSEFNNPENIALDQNGLVYVTDKDVPMIKKFDSNGNLLDSISGAVGDEIGQIRQPQDVQLDSAGNIYVLEPENDRIQFLILKEIL